MSKKYKLPKGYIGKTLCRPKDRDIFSYIIAYKEGGTSSWALFEILDDNTTKLISKSSIPTKFDEIIWKG